MKDVLRNIITGLCLLTISIVSAQDTVENNAFKTGEYLKYRVYYSSPVGNFTAGEAILTVKNWKNKYDYYKKSAYHITGKGNSKGMFNWFFKVRDKFESYVNKSTLLPYSFVRKTREGNYKQDDFVVFDRERNIALTNDKDPVSIPPDVHDFVSALYFMRTLDVEDFNADSLYNINFFLDDSVYVSAVKFVGKEDVQTKWGSIRCLKIAPMMASGEVFAEKYPMFVWVTDDQNHLPVLAESEVIVGSVKMELEEYSNLSNPIMLKFKH